MMEGFKYAFNILVVFDGIYPALGGLGFSWIINYICVCKFPKGPVCYYPVGLTTRLYAAE